MSIKKLLKERATTHGEFRQVAALDSGLEVAFRMLATNSLEKDFNAYQIVALKMILHKLSRIGCGNPNEKDHWKDIAGYATLVVKELEKQRELAGE